MIWVIDESVDFQMAYRCHQFFPNSLIIQERMPGISDREVIQTANVMGALILTADKDFGELVVRGGMLTTGILLTRLSPLPLPQRLERLESLLRKSRELVGCFTVLSPSGVRQRPLQSPS
jgi:predicted nuclease of predicted toxin-antitoxin system